MTKKTIWLIVLIICSGVFIASLIYFINSYFDNKKIENLREEVSVHVETFATSFGYGFIISRTPDKGGTDLYHSRYEGPNDGGAWDRPEDAEAAALDYVIDNLI